MVFPWISACSPRGDPCRSGHLEWWPWSCRDNEQFFLGLPARLEVVNTIADMSMYCVLTIAATISVAAMVWWFLHRLEWRSTFRITVERYDSKKRFSVELKSLRPKAEEDADSWMMPARKAHMSASNMDSDMARKIMLLIEEIDIWLFQLTRECVNFEMTYLRFQQERFHRRLEDLTSSVAAAGLGIEVQDAVIHFRSEAEHVQRIALLRSRVYRLLLDRRFRQSGLCKKAKRIQAATENQAPLLFVHWADIEEKRELPKFGSPNGAKELPDLLQLVSTLLGVSCLRAERHIVPFFFSHRWLRTRTSSWSGHPDTESGSKARRLVTFAKWFMELAARKGLRCEVVFWIDWCCCEQDDIEKMKFGVAALPLFIASCTQVLTWRTPDFDRRCWLMVERLLCYSFCEGGLSPYAIDESLPCNDDDDDDVEVDFALQGNSIAARRGSEDSLTTWQVKLGTRWTD